MLKIIIFVVFIIYQLSTSSVNQNQCLYCKHKSQFHISLAMNYPDTTSGMTGVFYTNAGVQIDSGAHQSSYAICTRVSFHGDKAAGT